MANIKFMSWNIETLGPSKFYLQPSPYGVVTFSPNTDALFRVIVDTVRKYNVNLMSILEVRSLNAVAICTGIRTFLNEGLLNPEWNFITIDSMHQDTYCIFYRQGQGFSPVFNPPGRPMAGLTSENFFPSVNSPNGGRRPGYAIFETTDHVLLNPNVLFTVLCYHAMFSNQSWHGIWNIRNCSVVTAVNLPAGVTAVNLPGGITAVGSTIISGDFNVDYVTNPQHYNNAIDLVNINGKHVPMVNNIHSKSTLIERTPEPPNPPPVVSLDYRVNAYDSIFARNVQNPVPAPVEGIIDMIDNFMEGKLQVDCTYFFDLFNYPYADLINEPGARTAEDAWHFYRYGVSNHLPVLASFLI